MSAKNKVKQTIEVLEVGAVRATRFLLQFIDYLAQFSIPHMGGFLVTGERPET